MSYMDSNNQAPFGSIAIYRAIEATGEVSRGLRARFRRRAPSAGAFSSAQIADASVSVINSAAPDARRPGRLGRAVAALHDWSARRRTLAELDRLTEAQLEDIGLTPGHVEDLRRGQPLV